MLTKKFRITFTEEVLGTASANPDIHSEFIASKAPDAPKREEEIEAIGAEAYEEKSMTVFPRDDEGNPIIWDYQWKGFFKDACNMLRRADGTLSKNGIKHGGKMVKLTAYKKEIDGLLFVHPRAITLHLPEGGHVGECQRPLRAQTAQGERVALAHSETVPAGTWCEITIQVLRDELMDYVIEWLAYGKLRGFGQWRNSGKGKFECEVVE